MTKYYICVIDDYHDCLIDCMSQAMVYQEPPFHNHNVDYSSEPEAQRDNPKNNPPLAHNAREAG